MYAGRIYRSQLVVDDSGRIGDAYDLDTEKLGVGSYGSVCCGTNKKTGAVRAVKTISKAHSRYTEWIRQEGRIMRMMDHPHVIKLFETYEDSRHVFLVMELCSGGGLFERLACEGPFSEKQCGVLMQQIFHSVSYMHSQCICHRDLKPENFLFLTKGRVEKSVLKIIDFGVSCMFDHNKMLSIKAGTPYYTAPQILEGRYDKACDLWSCGVILYFLLSGEQPFPGKNDEEVFQKIRRGNYSFSAPAWQKISDDAKNLIRLLLKFNPNERCSADQALNNQWMLNNAAGSGCVFVRPTLVDSLRGFCAQSKLKKAALQVIARNVGEDNVRALRDAFMSLDTDHDGVVTPEELAEGLFKAGMTQPADLEEIVAEVDTDGSGAIDYTEFLAASLDRKTYLHTNLCMAAFRVFDRNGNGEISEEELEVVLGDPQCSSPREGASAQSIAELLREVDQNGDGVIDFKEFQQMMRSGPK